MLFRSVGSHGISLQGAVYLVEGPISGFVAMPDVATAYWTGEAENDLALSGVGLGDVNGDGSADVAIESPRAGAGGVVFIDLGALAEGDSVAFVDLAVRGGSTSYSFGLAASVGDLDGDGSDDLAVGDYSDTSAGEDAGEIGRAHV